MEDENTWSKDDDDTIADNWQSKSSQWLANFLDKSLDVVESRIKEMREHGIPSTQKVTYVHPDWSVSEDEFLIETFDRLSLPEISDRLIRSIAYVQERFYALGIKKVPPPSFRHGLFFKCMNPVCRVSYFVENGSTFKFCSKECEIRFEHISYPSKNEINVMYHKEGKSIKEIADLFDIAYGTMLTLMNKYQIRRRHNALPEEVKPKEKTKGTDLSSAKGGLSVTGMRDDIHTYTRSRWEANCLRVLNHLGYEWQYEPETFVFHNIAKGTRTYTPDIKIWKKGKEDEYILLEVKGYLRAQDKTKIKRFKKYYPDDFKRLQGIPQNDRVEAYRFFKQLGVDIWRFYDDLTKEYKDIIPNWEI